MKFATLSHLLNENNLKHIPPNWIKKDYIISPELILDKAKGYVIALKLLPKQVMDCPREHIRKKILDLSEKMGLGIMVTYPDSIDGIPELIPRFRGRKFPNAKNITKNLITLPVHPLLTSCDMTRISTLISQASYLRPLRTEKDDETIMPSQTPVQQTRGT